MRITPTDYKTLFRLDVKKGRVSGLLSCFIIDGSLAPGEPIITFDGSWWTFRINTNKERKLAKLGLSLFKNKSRYERYSREFKDYLDLVEKNIIPRYKTAPSDISHLQFTQLTRTLKKFWHYYGITEFVYHDLAYKEMLNTGDVVLKKNLEDLDKLKFRARSILNAFIIENGVLDNILKSLSNKFGINERLVKYFYLSELDDLFSNKIVDLRKIKERKRSFVIWKERKETIFLRNNQAKKIAAIFRKFEKAEFKKAANGLKGHPANKGVAEGKVVISPMLDMKAALEVAKRMKKGDILIVQSTNPDLMVLCEKAAAIVTDQGGMLSHAAIISRELNIPCLVGTINATKVFKDGDYVQVDANEGFIKIKK